MSTDEAATQADRMVEQAMKAAHPQAAGRQLQLERAAYALAQSARHAGSDRFGVDHPLTVAYRDVAVAAALETFAHTQDLIASALLDRADAPPARTDEDEARGLPTGTVYDGEIPAFADVMRVEEFRDALSCGAISEHDGSAYAVRDGMECSEEMDLHAIPADATHVAWYNK